MKFNRPALSTIIASVSILTLVACSSDDDDDSANGATDSEPADVVQFDEAIDGDIVDDPNNPTPVDLVIGQNRVNASMVAPDLDYLTINVPAGSELTAIELTEYTSVDDVSFIGMQTGQNFTETPEDPNPANLFGFILFGGALEGGDILELMGANPDAQGFTPPLEAGDYSFWIQDTGPDLVTYRLSFVVEETN